MGPMTRWPAFNFLKVSALPMPNEVMMPVPVITMLSIYYFVLCSLMYSAITLTDLKISLPCSALANLMP